MPYTVKFVIRKKQQTRNNDRTFTNEDNSIPMIIIVIID